MGPITLNVVVHGMFAIEIGDTEVTLYPPNAPGHVFLAGTWEQEQRLVQDKQYRLIGPAGRGTRPGLADLQPDQNAVFPRRSIDQTKAFCSIVMPFPNLITPLRLTPDSLGPFFTNSPSLLCQNPHFLPSVVVLTYEGISFQPMQWIPDARNQTANLHFFAMPPGQTDLTHPGAATQVFNEMTYYTDLVENGSYTDQPPTPIDLVPSVPGICCSEEKTLYERMAGTGAGGGVSPRMVGSLDCGVRFLY